MTARDIREHFISAADWVDPIETVDRIIIGDPEAEVSRALVSWISSFEAVRAAVERKCELLITHEPTFWAHAKELESLAWEPDSPAHSLAIEKKEFIEQHGLVVLRVHDSWDRWPDIGIPYAWAQFLGLGKAPAAATPTRLQQRYDIAPISLDEFARQVAERTASLGEPAVQVVGAGDRPVSQVGIGTGCFCDPAIFQQLGCDVSVVCDDGVYYWQGLQCSADNQHPIIRVNHGTSEEPGMVTLTQYVNDTFPGVEAEHLPHGACFRLVGRL
jgi:putative NIF3 family GTP cyclohydrolase 1 type 2